MTAQQTFLPGPVLSCFNCAGKAHPCPFFDIVFPAFIVHIWAHMRLFVKVLIETKNIFVSDVYRSVNCIGSLAKFT